MFPFSKPGRVDHTEKKALLFAFLFSALFIILLSLSVPAKRTRKLPLTTLSTMPPTKPAQPSQPHFADPLAAYRLESENFYNVDFWNFSYGVYTPPEGKPIALNLKHGLKTLPDSGWFEIKDVFYKDLTGDRRAEAIVRLSHVSCNDDSCDGGSDIFYIYTRQGGKLKNIWRYETGSYAYGCGLKSFILGKKQIVVELFGRCPGQELEYPVQRRFLVEDSTFKFFEFDGRGFSKKQTEFIAELARDVTNYKPDIRIY